MKVKTLIGVYSWEHGHMQALLLDSDIGAPEKAALSNDIGEAVHYGDVCETVRASLREQDPLLLEVLAERIVDLILRDFGVLWVQVKIVKSGMLPDVKEVGVEIKRGAPR